MQSITNQLSSMKMSLDDELQALLLLGSLPESWEILVVSLSNSTSDGIVTMSQVTSSLLNEELRRKNSATSQIDSQAIVSENKGRSKLKDRSGSRMGSRVDNDIGASYHATPQREFFATYRSENFGVVKMGNYGTTDIIGMRDIHIKTNLGCKLVLKDVRHVVDLRLNLIFVGRLDDEDFDVKACGEQLNTIEKYFSMELWHMRLGHMSEKGLQELSKRDVLLDLRDLEIEQLDVKTALFHSDLEEKIYVEQLEGFKVKGKENLVYKLKKSLYELKLKKKLSHFKLCSNQSPSSDEENEKIQKVPYASAVRSLMYAMVYTRPDIAYAMGIASRFIANPGKEHWAVVKWIFRYLRGSSKVCLSFGGGPPMLIGYIDVDMIRDIDTNKSTLGFVLTFVGGAVSWQSRLQRCIALSTTEVEYIVAKEVCKEILWIK
ncbi:hypothetical protein OPV22_009550 [Ensete ventricosum]|uniref:GAG-pre-integrase domain-containing protein n=1 Tax=Ensete ventricosum TaxID=4639 RepID=A0AAV8R5E4_ENSVE|nr:hypothetical protein OPV22_009550 [Ensete ventricosum]